MSEQSEAAKKHIEKLLNEKYGYVEPALASIQDYNRKQKSLDTEYYFPMWTNEYPFFEGRKWRFDYAVPAIRCANMESSIIGFPQSLSFHGVIELDGGTFIPNTGHSSGIGLRAWREKNNAAMSAGWRVWHYAPEEVIKAGRKMLSGRSGAPGFMRNPAQ